MFSDRILVLFQFCFFDGRRKMWIPYKKHGQWWLAGEVRTLREIGALCGIDEETLTVIKLKYGS